MRSGDRQVGIPEIVYKSTKSQIESLSAVEGMVAYATDAHEFGVFNGTSWVWGSGGGGGTYLNVGSVHHGDISAASPSSLDDEFTGDLSLWTEFDIDGMMIPSTENGLLKMSLSSGSGYTGMVQSIPSGDFTIQTHVFGNYVHQSGIEIDYGLILLEGLTGTSRFYIYGINFMNSIPTMHLAYWNHYRSWNATLYQYQDIKRISAYLRTTRSGTSYSFDWSVDGIGWWRSVSGVSLSFTPAYFGITAMAYQQSAVILVENFHYLNSAVNLGTTVRGYNLFREP